MVKTTFKKVSYKVSANGVSNRKKKKPAPKSVAPTQNSTKTSKTGIKSLKNSKPTPSKVATMTHPKRTKKKVMEKTPSSPKLSSSVSSNKLAKTEVSTPKKKSRTAKTALVTTPPPGKKSRALYRGKPSPDSTISTASSSTPTSAASSKRERSPSNGHGTTGRINSKIKRLSFGDRADNEEDKGVHNGHNLTEHKTKKLPPTVQEIDWLDDDAIDKSLSSFFTFNKYSDLDSRDRAELLAGRFKPSELTPMIQYYKILQGSDIRNIMLNGYFTTKKAVQGLLDVVFEVRNQRANLSESNVSIKKERACHGEKDHVPLKIAVKK